MARLHETLASVNDAITHANKTMEEAKNTLSKKPELLQGSVTISEHFSDEDRNLDTTEHKEIVTTVDEKLKFVMRIVGRAWDAYAEKEATNCLAKADVVIDDIVLAKDVPATVLLGLETKLAEVRGVLLAIPTLAPGPTWKLDPAQRPGIYKSEHPDVRFRTRKTMRAFELSKATEHHPAQVQAITEDTPIARITVQHWSGMISSAHKSALLERLDGVLHAVKRARQRANMQEVVKFKIADVLIKHILHGSS